MDQVTGVMLALKLSSFEDSEILLLRLQSLESDGPDINKTVWNKLNQ